MAIQPAEYILRNGIGWAEGCAISYLSRWRAKGGVEDLRKGGSYDRAADRGRGGRMSGVTDRMRECYEAVQRHGSLSAAASALGIARQVLRRAYRKAVERGAEPLQLGRPTSKTVGDEPVASDAQITKAIRSKAGLTIAAGSVEHALIRRLLERRDEGELIEAELDGETLRVRLRATWAPAPRSMPGRQGDKQGWHLPLRRRHRHAPRQQVPAPSTSCTTSTACREEGIAPSLNAGNWIDGEMRFNRRDLLVGGMNGQIEYLVENYPNIAGIQTWAITGDDHEGWYTQDSGVDIGGYAEMKMRRAGRQDWHDLGYMERDIVLEHGERRHRSATPRASWRWFPAMPSATRCKS